MGIEDIEVAKNLILNHYVPTGLQLSESIFDDINRFSGWNGNTGREKFA